MNYESYDDVLSFLEGYLKQRVKDATYLNKLEDILEGSRRDKTVAIRSIHQTFINYTEQYRDYSLQPQESKDMWRELLDIWQ